MIHSKEYKLTQAVSHVVCAVAALCAVLPFVLLIIASLTDSGVVLKNGFSFFPEKWSTEAYQYIIQEWQTIGHAYLMTIVVTAVGTAAHVTISMLFAYGISKKNIPGMKFVSFLLIFSMLFNGGLVSTYYCYVRYLGIKNTIWALIMPNMLMNAVSVILIRNYVMYTIPSSLMEAAQIDGAGPMKVLTRVVLPLSKPILATIGLMAGLAYWNDWMNGMYYLTSRGGSDLYTIQIVLNNINNDVNALVQSKDLMQQLGTSGSLPSTTIRMAIAVIGILPILVLYPFFQKYFVKGITLGGVKE
ncbi:sugar ABC transporter permease [Lachnoclostridium sp. An169]|uniref:carbohydrate ABC transporter permease n=1 Tax=Lachnoclostridium sp. An169 TaxID=1965569 RepID=UPI000B3858B2|nr:carbohydrate ABC transporter permease [Lachnoclostridium sp. An169]OUP84005.1 sugar ABC transporter permease [Lachnoclostridium sp. An169]